MGIGTQHLCGTQREEARSPARSPFPSLPLHLTHQEPEASGEKGPQCPCPQSWAHIQDCPLQAQLITLWPAGDSQTSGPAGRPPLRSPRLPAPGAIPKVTDAPCGWSTPYLGRRFCTSTTPPRLSHGPPTLGPRNVVPKRHSPLRGHRTSLCPAGTPNPGSGSIRGHRSKQN